MIRTTGEDTIGNDTAGPCDATRGSVQESDGVCTMAAARRVCRFTHEHTTRGLWRRWALWYR
jgi:hypothetical protein